MKRTAKTLFRATLLAASALALTAAAQSQALLAPDWNDPAVARANENLKKQERRGINERSAPADDLSLPRWGFSQDMRKSNSAERSRSRSIEAPSANLRWPACARANVQPKPVSDQSGNWYTDNYDFGCIFLSITGDRTYNPNIKAPDSAARTADCEDSTDAAKDVAKGGDREGRFDLSLRLNGIPYTITGQCFTGALPFCRDRKAQCALVDRLILRGGSKQ